MVTGRADQADADRQAAIALADQTVALLKDVVSRADRAEQGRDAERARVDALRDRVGAMQAQLDEAHASLQAATETERRVVLAEQGGDAKRTRADALRDRIGHGAGRDGHLPGTARRGRSRGECPHGRDGRADGAGQGGRRTKPGRRRTGRRSSAGRCRATGQGPSGAAQGGVVGGTVMPDDLTLTPSSGKIAFTGFEPKVVDGEDDRWTLPPSDKIEKMSRKALRGHIRAIIEHAERGDAQNRRGGIELAIIRAEYLREELARRSQNRQTRWIIS